MPGRGPDVRPRLQLHAEQLQQPRQGQLRQRAAQLLADTPPPAQLEGVQLGVGEEEAGGGVQEALGSEGEGVGAPGGGGGVGGPLQRQHHRARGQHPVTHLNRGAVMLKCVVITIITHLDGSHHAVRDTLGGDWPEPLHL